MKVFTYGSLKRDFCNHMTMVLAGGEYLKDASIKARLHAYCDRFPGAAQDEGYVTHGEIYEVSAEGLTKLDRLEGEGHFYHRRVVKTLAGEEVSVYFLKEEDMRGPLIEDGVWRERKFTGWRRR